MRSLPNLSNQPANIAVVAKESITRTLWKEQVPFEMFEVVLLFVALLLHPTLSFNMYPFRRAVSTPLRGFGRINKLAMSSLASLDSIMLAPTASSPTDAAQFVFVGGKGGVGKTTSSSAIALSLSDKGHKTLLVSTDPAHSLGDALGVDLSSGKLVRIDTETNLWALEIDVEASLREFEELMSGINSQSLSDSLGVPKEVSPNIRCR